MSEYAVDDAGTGGRGGAESHTARDDETTTGVAGRSTEVGNDDRV